MRRGNKKSSSFFVFDLKIFSIKIELRTNNRRDNVQNFVYEFFKEETIEHPLLDNLKEILEILQENYLNSIAKKYNIDLDKYTRNELIEILNKKIPVEFKKIIMTFDPVEHKSFNEFYRGMIDYSDENVYINLKKFSGLGIIFLFTENGGKLYNFRIPEEICEIYDEMLRLG